MAMQLPMHDLVVSQNVRAELRWQKTKDWRPYASPKESDQIEILVEKIGKILVQCEYISQNEIKQHILQD